MSENNYTRIDFIIIIIISLLASFIIGFNILQLIDNKLNSIVINVPPPNYKSPPIYLNLDKHKHLFINDENKHLFIDDENQSVNNTNTENSQTYEEFTSNSDYNDLNKIPLLVNPTPSNPNQNLNEPSEFTNNKIKLITNHNSPLAKLEELNKKNIMNLLQVNNNLSNNNLPNPKIGGYNTYVNLKQDSYANFTSLGKDLLTPYNSLPVPS